jgi:2-amino-4-hydroxy-6-hydroxymethyldihydropteridine diphosphokinase
MNLIYLSLGSNLGDREMHLNEAKKLIRLRRIGTIESVSGIYESGSWGYSSENLYYNCCVSLRTSLPPLRLLDEILEIEREMGRRRTGTGYSDRIIDIDLLFYGDRKLDHPRLKVPHPAIGDRRFVLVPMVEIAPGFIHPVNGLTMAEMLRACPDLSVVTSLASGSL